MFFSSPQVRRHNLNNNSTVLHVGFSVDKYNPSKNVGPVRYLSYFTGIIRIIISEISNRIGFLRFLIEMAGIGNAANSNDPI